MHPSSVGVALRAGADTPFYLTPEFCAEVFTSLTSGAGPSRRAHRDQAYNLTRDTGVRVLVFESGSVFLQLEQACFVFVSYVI